MSLLFFRAKWNTNGPLDHMTFAELMRRTSAFALRFSRTIFIRTSKRNPQRYKTAVRIPALRQYVSDQPESKIIYFEMKLKQHTNLQRVFCHSYHHGCIVTYHRHGNINATLHFFWLWVFWKKLFKTMTGHDWVNSVS